MFPALASPAIFGVLIRAIKIWLLRGSFGITSPAAVSMGGEALTAASLLYRVMCF